MDSIIQSWHRMGLHTPEEIEKGDRKPARKSVDSRNKKSGDEPSGWDDSKALAQIDRLLEKMKDS